MAMASMPKRRQESGDQTVVRERILRAAFAAFTKSGYATASTLEIATRARVSKRDLYALVGNKQEMLISCISERAKRFDVPADLPVLRDRETLAQVLASFGTKVVREASNPTVIACASPKRPIKGNVKKNILHRAQRRHFFVGGIQPNPLERAPAILERFSRASPCEVPLLPCGFIPVS